VVVDRHVRRCCHPDGLTSERHTLAAVTADDDVLALAERLFDLARGGGAGELGAYLDAGLPVDLTDASGNTLLMLAAYYGHLDAVTTLLAHGADPDRVNDRGQTPLAGAVFKRSNGVSAALLAAGADPDLGQPSARATAAFFGVDAQFD
jgi:uncharacterized protein